MTLADSAVPSDIEIAQAAHLRPIAEIAAELGLDADDVELYGHFKAKIALTALPKLADRPLGRYVAITGMSPTPLGEGKTTTTVGLGQALARLGQRSMITIRQPSLGPVFGTKGGAAGGGYAQVVPMEDFNLHLTGDNHAVGLAHNLLAAFIDNHLQHSNTLGIHSRFVSWRRVMDLNDRALRDVVTGLGGNENGLPRQTGFDITAASEVMAILALATSLADLRERLGRIVVAQTRDRRPITAEDLHCAGSMAVLLKDAIKPNLLQTLENTPAMVHAGPFGNIAHGNSSILADLIGLRLSDYLVTESGFGADLGFEKFCDIKCRVSGLRPDCAVLVATVRAIKAHSGRYRVIAGRPQDPGLVVEDLDAIRAGAPNLAKQIENARQFGVPVVVAVNRFASDSPHELELVRELAMEAGAFDAHVADHWAHGGAGAESLAEAVIRASHQPSEFSYLYDLDLPLKKKIETIAFRLYGASGVYFLPAAERKLAELERQGYSRLPICMAKTPLSLSHDPKLVGRPEGFVLPIIEVRLSAGAGFVYPLCGEIRTMPGLSASPAGERIDIDADGRTYGLF
jgi:formate--tetrahydrofolate ligase